MSLKGFVVYENCDIKVLASGVTSTPNGKFDVIHGTPNKGVSFLFSLTKDDAEMAARFLNRIESEGGAEWDKVISRLFWADHNHRGLDKLMAFSHVHGGVTVAADPLNLAIRDGEIVFNA